MAGEDKWLKGETPVLELITISFSAAIVVQGLLEIVCDKILVNIAWEMGTPTVRGSSFDLNLAFTRQTLPPTLWNS